MAPRLIARFKFFSLLLGLSAILLCARPIFAATDITVTKVSDGVLGENGWYIQKPKYTHVSPPCGSGVTILDLGWEPDEGAHSYAWAKNSSKSVYVRADNGPWVRKGGCENKDGLSTIFTTPLLKVDTVQPQISLSEPYEGEPFQQGEIVFKGSVADQSSGPASIVIDGQSVPLGIGGVFVATIAKGVGTHTVSVMAKDFAGNTGSLKRTIKVLAPSSTPSSDDHSSVDSSEKSTSVVPLTAGDPPASPENALNELGGQAAESVDEAKSSAGLSSIESNQSPEGAIELTAENKEKKAVAPVKMVGVAVIAAIVLTYLLAKRKQVLGLIKRIFPRL